MSMSAPSVENLYATRPGTATSSRTKITRIEDEDKVAEKPECKEVSAETNLHVSENPVLVGGEGESAIPEDKKVHPVDGLLFYSGANSPHRKNPLRMLKMIGHTTHAIHVTGALQESGLWSGS